MLGCWWVRVWSARLHIQFLDNMGMLKAKSCHIQLRRSINQELADTWSSRCTIIKPNHVRFLINIHRSTASLSLYFCFTTSVSCFCLITCACMGSCTFLHGSVASREPLYYRGVLLVLLLCESRAVMMTFAYKICLVYPDRVSFSSNSFACIMPDI